MLNQGKMKKSKSAQYFFLLICLLLQISFFPLATYSVENTKTPSAYAQKKIDEASKKAIKNANLYYDEIFDAKGKIREAYKDIYPLFAEKTKAELKALRKKSIAAFKKDNALASIPRIFSESDYDEIKKGVEQRGKALLLFLEDYYSGEKKFIKDGIISETILNRIIERSGEQDYFGRINPKDITFPYGPDLMRGLDPTDSNKTHWYVFEDNIGFLGGSGDLIHGHETLVKNVPEYKALLEGSPDPAQFYKNQISRYRAQLKDPKDLIIFYAVPPYSDNEDSRLKKIWKDLGVEIVTPNTKKKLIIENDEAYLTWKNKSGRKYKKKVGFIISYNEHKDFDLSHPIARKQQFLEDAKQTLDDKNTHHTLKKELESLLSKKIKTKLDWKKIEKLVVKRIDLRSVYAASIPNLIKTIEHGKVKTIYTPGIDFVGDKEFYTYVEDLIRYYLKEEPILRNIPTERAYKFNEKGEMIINKVAKQLLENDFDHHVLKIVDGRGGDGIWVGPKLSKLQQLNALKAIDQDFSRMQVQRFIHPSVLAGDIVDTRVLSQIGPSSISSKGLPLAEISPIPWVRGVPVDGNGKMNVSDAGHEVAALITPSYNTHACSAFYTELGKHLQE